MQFESKKKRAFFLSLALGFIPDILISIALAVFFESGILGFLFSFFGLQILYFLIWVKDSLWTWLNFQLKGRKKYTRLITDYLRRNKYPEPEDYEKCVNSYLSRVITDENQPIDLRLNAAASLAEMNFMSNQGQAQNYIRFSIAYEDALEIYKRSFANSGQTPIQENF